MTSEIINDSNFILLIILCLTSLVGNLMLEQDVRKLQSNMAKMIIKDETRWTLREEDYDIRATDPVNI